LPVVRYRIVDPTMAQSFEDGHHVAFTVPAGTLISVEGAVLNGKKLVDVICDRRTVTMFAHDLRSRAERIE
jgi:hypothetical protein